MLGATNVTGTVPCELFENHELRSLMISVNPLEGSLPACVLESTTLEELYMSRLPLTGDLPDSFSPDSQLRVWYAINKDPVSGDAAGPGFTGSIPSSLSNVAHLAFVELSHHQLTGGVPQLPARMRMAEFQSNQLDGSIACEWRPLAGLARYMCQCKCRCCCNRAVFVLQSQFGVASS
eukprot:GHRQ01033664.1.p1 GENE.GHRQ01033664.1~~GHRQ01033664.1.p1  ORF type:complete len:178 (-),score=61.11 GHRQ01033664.1:458-991(-)